MADTGNKTEFLLTPEVRRYIAAMPSFWESKELRSMFAEGTVGSFYFTLASDRKTWAYFQKIVRTNSYLAALAQLRKKYKVNFEDDSLLTPKQIGALRKEVLATIGKKYKLTMAYVEMVVNDVLKDPDPEVYDLEDRGVCVTVDRTDSTKKPRNKQEQEHDLECYPIALKISPYATKRDLIEYVTKAFRWYILPLQEKHRATKNHLTSVKARMKYPLKNTPADLRQERDQLIYRLRDWPLKKIVREVREVFALYNKPDIFIMDEGHVAKIISIEKKRREV